MLQVFLASGEGAWPVISALRRIPVAFNINSVTAVKLLKITGGGLQFLQTKMPFSGIACITVCWGRDSRPGLGEVTCPYSLRDGHLPFEFPQSDNELGSHLLFLSMAPLVPIGSAREL